MFIFFDYFIKKKNIAKIFTSRARIVCLLIKPLFSNIINSIVDKHRNRTYIVHTWYIHIFQPWSRRGSHSNKQKKKKSLLYSIRIDSTTTDWLSAAPQAHSCKWNRYYFQQIYIYITLSPVYTYVLLRVCVICDCEEPYTFMIAMRVYCSALCGVMK